MPSMKAYAEDLAYIHDVGHGHFARQAAPGLLQLLRDHRITSGTVVDLGCGSGIWADALVKAGYGVLGIDISAAMIDIARQRVPKAQFQVGSYLKADLPPCVAVTSIGECLNYLFDRGNGLNSLVRLCRRVHRALQPGGVLIFDILQPGCVKGAGPQRSFREGPDWAVLVEKEENRKRRLLTRWITSFRKIGGTYRRHSELHCLQLYPGAAVLRELRQVGFRVTRLPGYGEMKFSGTQMGFLACKAIPGK